MFEIWTIKSCIINSFLHSRLLIHGIDGSLPENENSVKIQFTVIKVHNVQ